jgi:hypothetical protein
MRHWLSLMYIRHNRLFCSPSRCSPLLGARVYNSKKGGEGTTFEITKPNPLHQLAYLEPGITLICKPLLRVSFFRYYSGAYYSKTGSVSKTVPPRASLTFQIMWDFYTSTLSSLQHENGVGESIELDVLPLLDVL